MCEGGGLRSALREDLDRYVYRIEHQHGVSGRFVPLRLGLLTQGLWATAAYRLNHYARHGRRSRRLTVVPDIVHRVIMVLTGIHIDPDAHVGPGLKIPHSGNITIGPVRIGTNCDIFQNVTLGASESTLSERQYRPDLPTLGDRVWVGPGAVVAGGVTVGNDAVVSANSLLVRDAPARGVMIGVPARLVSRQGSFTQITYRTMESDDERKLALADLETDSKPAP
jgi:serine O-acetyltransferase